MRIIAFFAFVATVSATTIFPSTKSNCGPPALPFINQCGVTSLNYDIVAYKIQYEGQEVSWFRNPYCEGQGVPAEISSDICIQLPFIAKCVRIDC